MEMNTSAAVVARGSRRFDVENSPEAAVSAGARRIALRTSELEADGDTSFVLGSAIKHPHPLVLGYYSVHTSGAALAQGEAEINRIGQRLRAAGRL
jgi:hypothetical protein